MARGEGQARGSFEARMWGDAFAELSAAQRKGQLDAEDLERLAVAAYMVGRDEACEEATLRCLLSERRRRVYSRCRRGSVRRCHVRDDG